LHNSNTVNRIDISRPGQSSGDIPSSGGDTVVPFTIRLDLFGKGSRVADVCRHRVSKRRGHVENTAKKCERKRPSIASTDERCRDSSRFHRRRQTHLLPLRHGNQWSIGAFVGTYRTGYEAPSSCFRYPNLHRPRRHPPQIFLRRWGVPILAVVGAASLMLRKLACSES
jgi:hypothetical protein